MIQNNRQIKVSQKPPHSKGLFWLLVFGGCMFVGFCFSLKKNQSFLQLYPNLSRLFHKCL